MLHWWIALRTSSRFVDFGCENKHPHTTCVAVLLNRFPLGAFMFWLAYELITCSIRKKTLKQTYKFIRLYVCFRLETPVDVFDNPVRWPRNAQGELTAMLWKLDLKWKRKFGQPSRVLFLFKLCCYQIYYECAMILFKFYFRTTRS